ncbi:glycosyltransferase [Saccharospirillum impatiens]|uniref:glycosyltransferase n=1 Tax=Saccharospirillum impatiens TaxID=169438 RepID=UPI00049190F0|nr:glycosyltransferase [Saccharospirillum impatiens]
MTRTSSSFSSKCALFIAKNWPEPASTAAGRRTLDILDLCREAGYQIHIASPADASPFQHDLTDLGYQSHSIAVNDSAFDAWIASLAPQLVIYDRFVMEEQFGWRVREQCPDAATLLDTSDFHTLREARHQAVRQHDRENTPPPWPAPDLFTATAERELAAMARCDCVVMISRVEIDLLQSVFKVPTERLLYLPFLIPDLPDPNAWRSYADRQHLMMIGGFKHAPNKDAVAWFRQTVWPLIRPQLAGVECHVYGAYADHAVQQWHAPRQGFSIKGRCDNALETLSHYRLNVAPLRFGAGQKGKILEGWLSGTPTVTTPIGAESMVDSDALGYPLSDEPEQLAATLVQLYSNQNDWTRVQTCGHDALEQGFLREHHAPRFIAALHSLQDNLTHIRHQNLWGRILWQSQHRATEYMSRWIEAKNRPPN